MNILELKKGCLPKRPGDITQDQNNHLYVRDGKGTGKETILGFVTLMIFYTMILFILLLSVGLKNAAGAKRIEIMNSSGNIFLRDVGIKNTICSLPPGGVAEQSTYGTAMIVRSFQFPHTMMWYIRSKN